MRDIAQAIKWAIISVLFFAVTGMVTSAITGLMRVIEDQNARNNVLGEAKIIDYWEDFDIFDVDAGTYMDFYPAEGGGFLYKREYLVAYQKEFDGDEHQFNLLVNGQPATRTTATAGELTATHLLRFLDSDGSVKSTVEIEFRFIFYSDRVSLTVFTQSDATQMGLLKRYTAVRGFRFRLIEEVYNPVSNETEQPTHVFVYFQSEGETIDVFWIPHNTVKIPDIPVPAGYEIYSFKVAGKEIDINTFRFSEASTTVDVKIGLKRYYATFTNGVWSEKVTFTVADQLPKFPTPPEMTGFNFVGWDTDAVLPETTATYTALYEMKEGFEGSLLTIKKVPSGSSSVSFSINDLVLHQKGNLYGLVTLMLENKTFLIPISFKISELPVQEIFIDANSYYGYGFVSAKLDASGIMFTGGLTHQLISINFFYSQQINLPPAYELWDGTAETNWFYNNETYDAELGGWLIHNASQLAGLRLITNSTALNLNHKFFLAKNIYLNDPNSYLPNGTYDNSGLYPKRMWLPIGGTGTNEKMFSGSFFGNGFTIYGLEISRLVGGLFGIVQNAHFEDVNIEKSNVEVMESGGLFIGQVIWNGNITFINCNASGNLTFDNFLFPGGTFLGYIGGFIGVVLPVSEINIENSFFNGTIRGEVSNVLIGPPPVLG